MALDFINKFIKWGYGEHNGPHKWETMFPIAAQGVRQSPINIIEEEVEKDSNLHPVSCSYGDGEYNRLENTGASWQLHLWPEETSLTGGPLHGEYEGFQIHAHWGSEPGRGSEHTIRGRAFDAEIHIVHYNKKYANAGEALNQEDGLAVLGILVKEGKHHPHFQILASQLHKIMVSGDETILDETFDPTLLLPQDRGYFTYPGSLTTPPLYESVTWILFNNNIELSAEQLKEMRNLMTGCERKKYMVDNYRPVNDHKGRCIRQFCS